MPTDAQMRAEYEAYLRGTEPAQPEKMPGRVEQVINNKAKAVAKKAEGPVVYEFSQSVENFPESLAKAGGDIAQMFMNPIDTAASLGKAAIGGMQRGTEGYRVPGQEFTSPLPDYRPEADAMGQAMVDRYGGLDQIKTTAMEDPVGMGLDILGGAALVPGKLGRMAARVDPTDLPFKAAGAALDPNRMYKSAANFPVRFDKDAVTNTALAERVMPTEGGLNKLEGLVQSTGDEIDALISNSVAKGELIDVNNILKPVNEYRSQVDTFNLGSAKDLKKIDTIVTDFNDLVKRKGYDKVTATEVQKFKRKIYDQINWSKKKSTGNKTVADTRKAFARGAKEELEAKIPEIKDLNLRQGDLIELEHALQNPASRIANRDFGGIGMPIKTTGGNLAGEAVGNLLGEPQIGQAVGTGLGALYGVLDSPTIKARLAIELNAIKNSPMSNAQARVAALELLRNVAAMEEEQ